jgi:hypothetical protein
MNVFGPREKDPLLQDDPLAPSSDPRTAAEDSTPKESPPAESEDETADSRLLLGSMTDAQEGKLTTLNRALANGWTLERVELRPADTLAFVLHRSDTESESSKRLL